MEETTNPTPEDAERKFMELLESADLPRPDVVFHDPIEDELVCRWEDEKLVVVVELNDPPITS